LSDGPRHPWQVEHLPGVTPAQARRLARLLCDPQLPRGVLLYQERWADDSPFSTGEPPTGESAVIKGEYDRKDWAWAIDDPNDELIVAYVPAPGCERLFDEDFCTRTKWPYLDAVRTYDHGREALVYSWISGARASTHHRDPTEPAKKWDGAWSLRDAAGVPGFRLHDLR
jgi:hypothetical protein